MCVHPLMTSWGVWPYRKWKWSDDARGSGRRFVVFTVMTDAPRCSNRKWNVYLIWRKDFQGIYAKAHLYRPPLPTPHHPNYESQQWKTKHFLETAASAESVMEDEHRSRWSETCLRCKVDPPPPPSHPTPPPNPPRGGSKLLKLVSLCPLFKK